MAKVRIGGIAVLLIATALASGCAAARAMSAADVQAVITNGLNEQMGVRYSVVCPAGMPVEAGYTFTCTVTDPADGSTTLVTVTETDDNGAFTWKADAPVQ